MAAGHGGKVVEHQTPDREVLGSIATGGTVLCPCAKHINSPVLVNTKEVVAPSQHD